MEIIYKNQFKKDYKKSLKQQKDMGKLEAIIRQLVKGDQLEPKFRDHALVGEFVGSRELHVEPDWLLMYTIKEDCLILERLGSHSELF